MDALIDQVISGLGAVLAATLVALVVRLLQKVGLSVDADKQAQLELYARQGIAKAEEHAAAYAKQHVMKLDPGAKLNIAISHVLSKLPRVDDTEAKSIIEAMLPSMGLGAAAGAAKLGEALRTPKG